jgi:two-component system cell cycle sensor histidine kinase/response regulator CckA
VSPSDSPGSPADVESLKTLREQAEQSLRDSERRLEAAQRLAQVGWWERDYVARRARLSDEAARIFGLGEEWRDQDLAPWDAQWRLLIHPEDLERVARAAAETLATGARYDVEYRITRPDGAVRAMHSRGDVTIDADGRPLRWFGSMQDITDLRRAEAELRSSEARFRTFVDHATDGFFLTARDGCVVLDVNEQACTSLGYAREELIGMTPAAFDAGLDGDAEQALRARLDAGEVVSFETAHRRKDGTVFPVEIRMRPFSVGGERFHVSLARDISERKRLEEELRQAQKMEAVGRLAGGVAHDFNNLLTVINGCGEMLLSGMSSGEPQRELVAEVLRAGERAAALTRQLLAFSRKQILQPRVVDVNARLGEITSMLRRLIGEDIRLVVSAGVDVAMTRIDPGQFEQAVINLVVNARDAMPGGGVISIETANVEVETWSSGARVESNCGRFVLLTVRDTGNGMDDATKARIFEPFFTTKDQGAGTGLGLAMVYGFVHQSGGHVEVVSEVGKGATFRIYLPRVDVAEPEVVIAPPPRLLAPNGIETVLLVEDEEPVRSLSRTILCSCGYSVIDAGDGEDALRRAELHGGHIDLLISDLVMPRMSGRRLAELLLQVRPSLRVLFMSGYAKDVVRTPGASESDFAMLPKPFTPVGLARKVREVLDAAPVRSTCR